MGVQVTDLLKHMGSSSQPTYEQAPQRFPCRWGREGLLAPRGKAASLTGPEMDG